jgi:anaerobic magnesium-protoporphyrin IX monomethyl ester cyclase
MSKIILIRPRNDVSSPYWIVPLGLLYIGTVLKKEGHDVIIIDALRQTDYREIIAENIDGALLAGITCLTSEVASAIEISDYIKSISDVPVIWGGWHPTLFPGQVCADKSVDFVCVGEGEYTMAGLAKALEADGSFEHIGGLAYKENGRVRVNPAKGYVNLEELPMIDYDLVDISRYIRTGGDGTRKIMYQSSRGCPYRCKFCCNPATNNRKYRAKSADRVIEEIESLVSKYNVNHVSFIEDNFFVNRQRAAQIVDKMLERDIRVRWVAECRADYFREGFVDEPFLEKARKSGLSKFTIGAESGSPRVLELLTKDITVEQVLKSARILSGFDINANYSFIIGVPGETGEEMMATVKLAEEIYRLCPSSRCGFASFTPYPGCELTDGLVKSGLFKQPATLREWSDEDVRALYYQRYTGKPWHEDARLLCNIVHYGRLAYSTYTYNETRKGIRKAFRQPWKYRGILLTLMAQVRMKLLFFALPFDKIPYNVYRYLRNTSRQIAPRLEGLVGQNR